ncbi:MAG: hypothetical protein Q8L01_01020, partial [Candidatus Woesebacteria bacterium]|nr:hypothetical protein [Candidatus Woesebacteria bacterium]
TARATVVRTSGGYIAIIPGGESRIISMQIDKAGKILPERYVNEIKSALGRDREIRKANIGAG